MASSSRRKNEGKRRWRSSWCCFWFFATQKPVKCIVPATGLTACSISTSEIQVAEKGLTALDRDEGSALSPAINAPPSSPTSVANSGDPPSMHADVALFWQSASICRKGCSQPELQLQSGSTGLRIGPYSHETELVTPVLSTLTTVPTTPLSTAPFTPPPELAHLATPSPPSPDVPFAEMSCSSLNAAGPHLECSEDLFPSLNLSHLNSLELTYFPL
eukprot:c21418_g1_i2 orf=413-1063(+)